MPATGKTKPLKLLPTIAQGAARKAESINQPLSIYISILLWNFVQAPVAGISAEPTSPKLARVHVPFSIRARGWSLIAPHIAASKLSANAFIEAVIARDLRSGKADLTILSRRV